MTLSTKHTKYVEQTPNISLLSRSSEASDMKRKCFQCHDFARCFANCVHCAKSGFALFSKTLQDTSIASKEYL